MGFLIHFSRPFCSINTPLPFFFLLFNKKIQKEWKLGFVFDTLEQDRKNWQNGIYSIIIFMFMKTCIKNILQKILFMNSIYPVWIFPRLNKVTPKVLKPASTKNFTLHRGPEKYFLRRSYNIYKRNSYNLHSMKLPQKCTVKRPIDLLVSLQLNPNNSLIT